MKRNVVLIALLIVTYGFLACTSTLDVATPNRGKLVTHGQTIELTRAIKYDHSNKTLIEEGEPKDESRIDNANGHSEYTKVNSERVVVSDELGSEGSVEEIGNNKEYTENGEDELTYEEIGTEEEYQEIPAETEIAGAEISAEEINKNGTVDDAGSSNSGGDDSESKDGDNVSGVGECVSGNGESGLVYIGDWTVTFYCQCEQCCGKWAWSNSTASGAVPQAGWTVAAGPSYPFGTILEIEGFGTYEVQDRGVPDGWVDIYVNSHDEIPSYGMTTTSVYVMEG